MSTEPPSSSPERPRHEPGDLRPGIVLLAAAAVVAMVLLAALIAMLLSRFAPPSELQAGALHFAPSATTRLRSSPIEERDAFEREKRTRLQSYGWANSRHDFAHVPIERAMEMAAHRPSTPNPGAQARGAAPQSFVPQSEK